MRPPLPAEPAEQVGLKLEAQSCAAGNSRTGLLICDETSHDVELRPQLNATPVGQQRPPGFRSCPASRPLVRLQSGRADRRMQGSRDAVQIEQTAYVSNPRGAVSERQLGCRWRWPGAVIVKWVSPTSSSCVANSGHGAGG